MMMMMMMSYLHHLSKVLAGYETTAFAYGQTGTGKTSGTPDATSGGLVEAAQKMFQTKIRSSKLTFRTPNNAGGWWLMFFSFM